MVRVDACVVAAVLVSITPCQAQPTAWEGKFPGATLHSPALAARMYLPNATNGYYRGTRFDWSGLVSRVEWQGHRFFAEFKREHDPLNHDDICGTADEFGIEAAPGYAEAAAGQGFIKIGIGVLQKPDAAPYAFWRKYPVVTPGTWDIKQEPDRIRFHQRLQGPQGWGYEFEKEIRLSPRRPEMSIIRRLRNTGSQTIDTDHYDHNFTRIDDLPAGTNYTLKFRFEPRLAEHSETQGCVDVAGRSLRFTKDPDPDKAIYLHIEGFRRPEDNWVSVVNHAARAAMTISTDRPLTKFTFYSSGGVLCPEAFVRVKLAPGQSMEWTTVYRFEVVPGD